MMTVYCEFLNIGTTYKLPTKQEIKMNRFEFSTAQLTPDEALVARDSSVRLYDGDDKVRNTLDRINSG